MPRSSTPRAAPASSSSSPTRSSRRRAASRCWRPGIARCFASRIPIAIPPGTVPTTRMRSSWAGRSIMRRANRTMSRDCSIGGASRSPVFRATAAGPGRRLPPIRRLMSDNKIGGSLAVSDPLNSQLGPPSPALPDTRPAASAVAGARGRGRQRPRGRRRGLVPVRERLARVACRRSEPGQLAR